MTITFKCGCIFISYVMSDGKEKGFLSCCSKHEKPQAQLENLGPIEVSKIKFGSIGHTEED